MNYLRLRPTPSDLRGLADGRKNEPETSQKVNDEFVLKETIANNKPTTSIKSVQPTKDVNEKENVTVAAEKPKKKAACFAESVEKISTEGEKETSSLQTNSPKEKVRPKKPEGKKKFGAHGPEKSRSFVSRP